jgi:hypothetical protein
MFSEAELQLLTLLGLPGAGGLRMTTREEILEALGQLDQSTFNEVINLACQSRRDPCEDGHQDRPDLSAGPEPFARWLAYRHMAGDAAIERVIYLPAGAPKNEIRLLEVNRLLPVGEEEAVEPLDFTPDIDGLQLRVLVADLTAKQWERIRREGGTSLPMGWQLRDSQIYSRG